MPRFYHQANTYLATVFADDARPTADASEDAQALPPDAALPLRGQRHDAATADERPRRVLEERRLDLHQPMDGIGTSIERDAVEGVSLHEDATDAGVFGRLAVPAIVHELFLERSLQGSALGMQRRSTHPGPRS